MAADLEFKRFLIEAGAIAGIDLTSYKPSQLQRRLGTMMKKANAPGYTAYLKLLRRDEARLREFIDLLTINVSEFFRNPERYEELKSTILPELLLKRIGELKIWSAGCANGAEPYSIAMILHEMGQAGRYTILATDIDRNMLEKARSGLYSEAELRGVSPARIKRFFTPENGSYRIRQTLRASVRFEAHDLLRDPFEPGYDLIACRNVAIYFTDEAKGSLYARLCGSLVPGGVLFLGGTEYIIHPGDVGLHLINPGFYRRISEGRQAE